MSDFPTYRYKDPSMFTHLPALLLEIDNMLAFLENASGILKGRYLETKAGLKWYDSQVVHLKQYYERAERLILDEQS